MSNTPLSQPCSTSVCICICSERAVALAGPGSCQSSDLTAHHSQTLSTPSTPSTSPHVTFRPNAFEFSPLPPSTILGQQESSSYYYSYPKNAIQAWTARQDLHARRRHRAAYFLAHTGMSVNNAFYPPEQHVMSAGRINGQTVAAPWFYSRIGICKVDQSRRTTTDSPYVLRLPCARYIIWSTTQEI